MVEEVWYECQCYGLTLATFCSLEEAERWYNTRFSKYMNEYQIVKVKVITTREVVK